MFLSTEINLLKASGYFVYHQV